MARAHLCRPVCSIPVYVEQTADAAKTADRTRRSTLSYHRTKFAGDSPAIFIPEFGVFKQDVHRLVLHIIPDSLPSWIRAQNTQSVQKLLVPGLISSIISPPLLTTSTTENPNLPTPTPLPPDLLPSILSLSETAAALYGGVLFISRTFSQRCATHAPGDAICMQSLIDTFFQAYNKNPAWYLLTIQQVVENDYPIPSCLADVFQQPEGRVEMLKLRPMRRHDHRPSRASIQVCLELPPHRVDAHMRLATLILASRIPLGHLRESDLHATLPPATRLIFRARADMGSTHVARSHRRPGGHDLEEAPGQHLGGTEDHELILGPIARLHSWAIQPNYARTRTVTVDHGTPVLGVAHRRLRPRVRVADGVG
ncbi:hypothetical protein EDB83DRAFT_2321841 [Lactarius deliciosus]|nr:hypothetical protein EDB83DRAFT_2321841 [Lactarius deliciosus]